MSKLGKLKTKKERRAYEVLLKLVDLYLESGKPIGSQTLRENGFLSLSTATIRNYFAEFEEEDYLSQMHASGGRIPTEKAFRAYATEYKENPEIGSLEERELHKLKGEEPRQLASFFQLAAENLSRIVRFPVFLSSLRFDHDFISAIKLVQIDAHRLFIIIITDFGQIFTELLPIEKKLTAFSLRRIEGFFEAKLHQTPIEKTPLDAEELQLARQLFNEVMVRYLVRYSNFTDDEIYRTGFSHLLAYPEFNDPVILSHSLSLFENSAHMRSLLDETTKGGGLKFWIGSDLGGISKNVAVIAIPYRIKQIPVGSVAILGPTRLPYRRLFGSLSLFSTLVSEMLTKSLYKHKLTYRMPRVHPPYLEYSKQALIPQTEENKSPEI